MSQSQEKEINNVKIKLIKRLLQLSYSTPSSLVKYEFGVIDMDIECSMEKILLANKTMNRGGLGRALLIAMYEKNVPGFCTELKEALKIFGLQIKLPDEDQGKMRSELKRKMIELQEERLFKQMICESKANQILLSNFQFNGQIQTYLVKLLSRR